MRPSHIISATAGILIGVFAQFVLVPPSGSADEKVAEREQRRLSALVPNFGAGRDPSAPVGEGAIDWERFKGIPAASAAEYAAYLERHGHSVEAMLAVFLLTEDQAYLIDAARRHPDDPKIQLLVICEDALPDERRAWIERFRVSQPDNYLAGLFYAGDLLKAGDVDEGLAELRQAIGLGGYEDFSIDGGLAMESALIEFGHTPLDVKMRSSPLEAIRHVNPMNKQLNVLRDLLEETEDPEKRAEISELGVAAGLRMQSGKAGTLFLNQLVGIGNASRFLEELDPDTALPSLGKSVVEVAMAIDEFKQVRLPKMKNEGRAHELTEQEYIHLLDRSRTLGGSAAIDWLGQRFDESTGEQE